jgi:flagellar assembly protein FliH
MSSSSPRIIRSEQARDLSQNVQYNYEDLRDRCEKYLDTVREKVRQQITDTEKQAEQLRTQAIEQGRKDGEKQGLIDAEKKIAQQVEQKISQRLQQEMKTILPALQQSISLIRDAQQQCMADWEREVVMLSCRIAEKVIRRELKTDPVDCLALVKDILNQTVGQTVAKISISPQDYQTLLGYHEKKQLPFAAETFALINSDSTITPGGCLVKTQHGIIDATVEKQLDRIVEELTPHHE